MKTRLLNEQKQPAPLSYEDLEIIFNTIDDNFTFDEVGEYEDVSPTHPPFGDYAFFFEKTIFELDLMEKTLRADVVVGSVEDWLEGKETIETRVVSVDI